MKLRTKILPLIVAIVMLLQLVPVCAARPKDGSYLPSSFQYLGGTGRVTISCLGVTLKNGAATAEIEFGSGSYDYIKIGETKYNAELVNGKSRFKIPVTVNGETKVLADTIAMSKPHEIEYIFKIKVDQASEQRIDRRVLVGIVVVALLGLSAGAYSWYRKKKACCKKER